MFFIFTHLYHTILSYKQYTLYKSKKLASPDSNRPPKPSTSPLLEKTFRDSPATETIPTRLGAELYELEQFCDTSSDARTHGTWMKGVGMVGCTSRKLIGKLDCMICLMISQLTWKWWLWALCFCKRWFKKYCICFCFSDHISSSSQVLNCAMFLIIKVDETFCIN